tara:strand:- start:65 stop:1498 length:1434 start_codon:yes stop_codon:yes gene_type:complete
MADTGWIKWGIATDAPSSTWANLDNITRGNTGETTCDTNSRILSLTQLYNNGNFSIPEGSKITGIAYKFRAKRSTGTGTVQLKHILQFASNLKGNETTTTLTDSYVDYEIGGDGNFVGIESNLIKDIIESSESLTLQFTSVNSVGATISIEGTEDSPAIKIFYESPPANTLISDWTRFTTIDDSNQFTDVTNLASPNEGTATWLDSTFNPLNLYFIGSGFDFGIPSNATVVGIQFRISMTPSTLPLQTGQDWAGKLSTSTFSESDITDEFFTISNNSRAARSTFQTGSYDNTFGLTLTGTNVNNLKLGFKATDDGTPTAPFLRAGSIDGEAGDGPTIQFPVPALRVFYTVPPRPKSKDTTSKVVIAPEIKGPFQTSKLNRLTSGLSLQGGDTNPAPEAATKIKVDPLLLDKFNKEGGIPNSPTTAPNSVTDTRNAQKRANASTLNKPRLNPVDRDSETGLTNTDEAPLFTRRRFDPL